MDIAVCVCGFETSHRSNYSRHKKRCSVHMQPENQGAQRIIDSLVQRLNKANQIANAAEARPLPPPPQYTNNIDAQQSLNHTTTTTFTTTNMGTTTTGAILLLENMNRLGHESTAHITNEMMDGYIAVPDKAVAKLVRAKRRVLSNRNVQFLGERSKEYKVVDEDDEDDHRVRCNPSGHIAKKLRWVHMDKETVLRRLYDMNSSELQTRAVATEDENVNARRFMNLCNAVLENPVMLKQQHQMIERELKSDPPDLLS